MSIESILRGYTSLTPLTKDKQQNRLRCSLGTVAKQRSALAGPSVTSSPATVDRELQFIPPPTTFIGLLCSSITTRSCTERSALPGGEVCNGTLTRFQNPTTQLLEDSWHDDPLRSRRSSNPIKLATVSAVLQARASQNVARPRSLLVIVSSQHHGSSQVERPGTCGLSSLTRVLEATSSERVLEPTDRWCVCVCVCIRARGNPASRSDLPLVLRCAVFCLCFFRPQPAEPNTTHR